MTEIEIKVEGELEVLTYEERLELIPALVDVARAYYEEPDKINTLAGICYNVMEIGKVKGAYWKIGALMQELGYNGFEYFEGENPTDTKDDFVAWEKRAMMCLILSEYLWSTLDAAMPVDIVEPEPKKSTLQKLKDKVNEVQENLRLYFETRDSLNRKIKGS